MKDALYSRGYGYSIQDFHCAGDGFTRVNAIQSIFAWVVEYEKLFHLLMEVVVGLELKPIGPPVTLCHPNRSGILIQSNSRCDTIPVWTLCMCLAVEGVVVVQLNFIYLAESLLSIYSKVMNASVAGTIMVMPRGMP